MKITMPLHIITGIKKKRKHSISMNTYRNMHHVVSNNVKKLYKEEVKHQFSLQKKFKLITPLSISYTYFNSTKRRSDLGNFCSIHDKFFSDALVELGYIEDDNYEFIKYVQYIYGGYDKDKGRVEIEIIEINNTFIENVVNKLKYLTTLRVKKF